ncbi:MAG: S8 family serine peptidase [Actinobacteria bacterium]|nr:S8 family serine peptidase [Actinomycetota bacterium]
MATVVATVTLAVPVAPAAAGAPALEDGRAMSRLALAEFSPDRLLVRFSGGVPERAAATAVEATGARLGEELFGWRVVEAPGRAGEVAQRLRGAPGVQTVERDHLRRAALEPNDPYYPESQKPYLDQVRLPTAWDATLGSGVVIAVLDSGVDQDHPDLAGSRLLPGRDFINGDTDPQDDYGHGTLVTGVAAATTNNGIGVAGVAGASKILPVKVLDNTGAGPDSKIAEAVKWAADQGADVINLSFGLAAESPVLRAALDYALAKDAVLVAAAGNEGTPVTAYPGAHPGVLAVTAVDSQNRLTYFSNWSTATDLAAPGVKLAGPALGRDEVYGRDTGTSFAAAIVSGIAALVRADQPTWTQSQVAERLRSSARDAGPVGFDPYFGSGIVDAAAALGAATPQAALSYTRDTNDTMAGATALATASSGTIVPEGDVDWYYADAANGGPLTFTVQPPATVGFLAFDPVLQIFNALGTALTGEVDAKGAGQAETASVSVPAAGRYYLKARNFHGSQSPGAYAVSASLPPAPAPAPAPAPTTTTTTAPPPPPPPPRSGYWMVGSDGAVYAFGDAPWLGGASSATAVVDLEPTPSGRGYWLVNEAGQVFASGDAAYHGGLTGPLGGDERVTSLSATPTADGYWLFTTRGRVVPFGNAPHLGDMSATRLNGPVLDSIPTPSGRGYYMVASDGGIFAFGDAAFSGSMGGIPLNAPVQSLVPDPDGAGYWLVASDGGIFAFAADFYGSMGSTRLNKPVTGMVGYRRGYLMVAEDGGIFAFGDAPFAGSLGDRPPSRPITSVAILR